MVVQHPLFQLKGAPRVSFIKNEEERRHFNRKMLKHLTPEQKEELKALHIDMWEGFNRVLKQMPKALWLSFRYYNTGLDIHISRLLGCFVFEWKTCKQFSCCAATWFILYYVHYEIFDNENVFVVFCVINTFISRGNYDNIQMKC